MYFDLKLNIVILHKITVEGIAVDWINNKLYWTDVQTRWIGVMDLNTRFYKALLVSEADASPREIAVDSTTRYIYSKQLSLVVNLAHKTFKECKSLQFVLQTRSMNEHQQ